QHVALAAFDALDPRLDGGPARLRHAALKVADRLDGGKAMLAAETRLRIRAQNDAQAPLLYLARGLQGAFEMAQLARGFGGESPPRGIVPARIGREQRLTHAQDDSETVQPRQSLDAARLRALHGALSAHGLAARAQGERSYARLHRALAGRRRTRCERRACGTRR